MSSVGCWQSEVTRQDLKMFRRHLNLRLKHLSERSITNQGNFHVGYCSKYYISHPTCVMHLNESNTSVSTETEIKLCA